ncbi:MAG: ATPase [Methanosphaera sp. rholeuAM6]|nr:MAG: ATPase [Methanosphaera sp. rholeuAM6]
MMDIAWGSDEELTDKQFYNRISDIEFISGLLDSTRYGSSPTILLTGVRGVGKTVLMKKLKKDLGKDYLICYVNLTSSNTYQMGKLQRMDIIKIIYNELINSAEEKGLNTLNQKLKKIIRTQNIKIDKLLNFEGIPIPITSLEEDYPKLSEFVMNLPQKLYEEYSDEIKGVFIFFDEFQNIKDLDDEMDAFLWYLRSKVQSQKNVAYLFSGSMSLKDKLIEDIAGKEGAFGGRILTIEIKPFNYVTTKNYLENNASDLQFTKDGIKRFYNCTKGVPFYINIFAKLLPVNEKMNEEKIIKYFKKSLPILGTHLINQWGKLTYQEQRIITSLIDEPLKRVDIAKSLNVTSGSISHSLNSLQNKILIELNNGKYEITDSILKYWLKNYYKERKVYPYRSM